MRNSEQSPFIPLFLPMSALIMLFMLLQTVVPLHAQFGRQQTQSQETQVPLDYNGKVMVLTQDMERALRIFPDYPDFLEARLFQLPDSSYALEIASRFGNNTRKNRIPKTLWEVMDLRSRITVGMERVGMNTNTDTLATQENPDIADRITPQERRDLPWAGASLGGMYGMLTAFAVSSSPSSGASAAFTGLLGGALLGGLGVGLAMDNPTIKRSAFYAGLHGLSSGPLHGILLYGAMTGWENFTLQGFGATSLLSGAGEAIAASMLAERYAVSVAHSSMLWGMGDMGMVFGIGGAYLGGLFDGGNNGRIISLASLGATAAGFYVGDKIFHGQHFTEGDARVFWLPSSLGLLLGTSAMLGTISTSTLDPKVFVGGAMASAAAGLLAGSWLVQGKDFTPQQGQDIASSIVLGLLGGYLGGYLAVLGTGRGTDFALPFVIGTLGGATGFALSYASHAKEATRAAQEYQQRAPRSSSSLWNVRFSPIGLAFAGLSPVLSSPVSVPFVHVQYTFPVEQEQ